MAAALPVQSSGEPACGAGAGRLCRRGRWGQWLGLALSLFLAGSFHAQNGPSLKEHEVKALYLYNFTKYIEWPAEAFATSDTPFTIGVLGTRPLPEDQKSLLEDLKKIIEGKHVGHRSLAVCVLKKREDLAQCHVVFFRADEEANWAKWQDALQGRPILAVGESDDFLTRGGVISFLLKQNKVGLCINLDAARQLRLTISAKLLAVAEVRHIRAPAPTP